MAEETQAIIRFVDGWVEDGVSEDGLPRYRPTIRIIKSVPPLTQVEYEATEADFEDFPGPYQLYQKDRAARSQEPVEDGFPLALWPVVNPAQFKMLVARDINTVEQLAKLSGRADTPGEFKELIDRAKTLIAMSADLGKFEAQVRELTGERDELAAQVKELQGTVSAQNAMINTLKMRVA